MIIFDKKDLLDRLTEEQNMHDATRDQLTSADKRASSYRAELDETKSLYERVLETKRFYCFLRVVKINISFI